MSTADRHLVASVCPRVTWHEPREKLEEARKTSAVRLGPRGVNTTYDWSLPGMAAAVVTPSRKQRFQRYKDIRRK